MFAARAHVRYNTNYWYSYRDLGVFDRIACIIVEIFFLLPFDPKFSGVFCLHSHDISIEQV
jgi:hypothetical protein